ncbi:MAG: hypothetical protein HND27_04205 [Bacteroidetes bacterium]|nr:hypothetical protein [Bacteroidota bacterium]MBV6460285.1 hypothetical protein [Flavobacteriales bacterium]WKZ74653.1 MAG: hypothetical protein QY303_10940 [Vicingaceae bacterium]MCL4815849.1 hypothetical protein [Flavobacteriales bacterium]NOG94960.1 hypothetical protein [Bacteroidota bacterium]
MVKSKALLLLIFCFRSLPFFAQSDVFIEKGLLRFQGTLSAGKMLQQNVKNVLLHGDMEYYTDQKISIRSDVYYFVNSPGNNKPLKQNHSLFVGSNFHLFSQGSFDAYIGIQPGVALSQSAVPKESSPVFSTYPSTFNPLFSGIVGFNYYGPQYFHLFIQARYISGNHLSDVAPIPLEELRVSFGLGFNLNVLNLKN